MSEKTIDFNFDKLNTSKLSEKIVSSVQEHYKQLLPFVNDIYDGKDVSSHYDDLDQARKLVTCVVLCASLATDLDKQGNDPKVYINNVGKFLKNVSAVNALVAVRSQIGLERMVTWELDSNEEWLLVMDKVNKLNFVSSSTLLSDKNVPVLSWEDVLNKAENDGN